MAWRHGSGRLDECSRSRRGGVISHLGRRRESLEKLLVIGEPKQRAVVASVAGVAAPRQPRQQLLDPFAWDGQKAARM